jgi:DNA-binding CsgD family transcriptional regulator
MPKPFRTDSRAELPPAWDLESFGSGEDTSESTTENGPDFALAAESEAGHSSVSPVRGPLNSVQERLAIPRDVLLALTYGLELVRCGAMLVREQGQPCFANRSALEILKKNDGLLLARTGLIAERASDTRLLRQLMRDAITSPESGEPNGSPITLPRKKARTSLIVRVLPGPGLDCWPDEESRAALVTIYDEENSVQVDETVLIKLYGLTRGEAQLAAILLKGKSIEEAAAELFISPHTARTHLKRIFMKTDTHRQTELVVRIFSALL